jgi:hypothetical protein
MHPALVICGAVCMGSAALLAFPPGHAAIQQNMLQRCQRSEVSAPTTERDTLPGGEGLVTFRNGLTLYCPVEQRRLRADSAFHFERQQRLELYGNVVYTERLTEISAQRMNYYRRLDYVEAHTNVRAQLEGGSSVEGNHITYYAKHPQLRPRDSLRAIQRPTFRFVERDSVSGAMDTTRLVAETVFVHGDEVFASDAVQVTRTEMVATGDSMYANRNPYQRVLRFMRNPAITGQGTNQFRMTGKLIELKAASGTRKIEKVEASEDARVESADLNLVSDTIHLQLAEQKVSGAQAWGDSAHMESRGSTMRGNRLDILMPGGKLAEIRAQGQALALLPPDTAKVESEDKDFMKGDTIIVQFEEIVSAPRRVSRDSLLAGASEVVRPDTSRVPRFMLAIGSASLFVQQAGAGGNRACPSLHHWKGERIEATLSNRQVQEMKVSGAEKNPHVFGLQSTCDTGAGGRGGRTGGGGRGTGRGGINDTASARIPPP